MFMKKIIFPLLALLALSVLPACSEKFKVAAPYKNITVIYGLLDQSDTAHYIRIQKAFLDDNKSAISMSKEPDSSFYSNINVVMKRIDMYSHKVRDIIQLNRVDLGQEGYAKDSGLFFNTPNYAYKFRGNLDSTLIYRLVVTNGVTGEVDSAEAPIIADRQGSTSAGFYVYLLDDTTVNHGKISFSSSNQYVTVNTLYGMYYPPYNFLFQGYTSPVGIVQGYLRFNWVDSNTTDGSITPRHYDMDLGYTGIYSDVNFGYKPKNLDLINALNNGMGAAPAYIVRLLDRCDLTFYLGSYDFNTYIQVQQLQGIGLTGNEIQPNYTNVKGGSAVGLFTSRGKRTGKVTIDGATVGFLMCSPLLTDTRIRGTSYH
jgi:hypothetical protein